MNKPLLLFISCESRLTGSARVCLAPAKTRFEAASQYRNQGQTIGTEINRRPLIVPSLTRRQTRWGCAILKSP